MAQQVAFKGGSKKGQERRAERQTRRRRLLLRLLLGGALVGIVALAGWLLLRPKPRVALPPLPTPERAVNAFWEALGKKDYARCLLLCPGLAETYGGKGAAQERLHLLLGRRDELTTTSVHKANISPDGRRASVRYTARLKSKREITGSATLRREADGTWRITGGI